MRDSLSHHLLVSSVSQAEEAGARHTYTALQLLVHCCEADHARLLLL